MIEQRNIPELRFPEFNGEWEEKRLENLFSEFRSGIGITAKEISESGDYPVYGGNGLRGYTNSFSHDGFYLLIGRQGALCGNINRSNGLAYISEHAIACQANESSDTEWMAQRLDYYNLNRLSESSAQPGLSVNKLLRFKLIIPKLPEQQKIASFFTAIDQKISQLKQKNTLLEQYKKGVMQKIFSQEIRFRDDNGQEFSRWEKKKKLREIATFYSGGTPATTNKSYYDGDIPFIKSGEISCDKTEQFISSTGLKNSSAKLVEEGNILFALYGATSGEVAISKINGAINQAVLCIRSKENHFFIYSYLRFKKGVIINTYLQGGQGNLSAEIVKSIEIGLPSKPEQTKIADFLSAIDDKINYTQTQIDKTKTWKKGLLQSMFI